MAELADAHGSGPCESNFMQVQVLLPAPKSEQSMKSVPILFVLCLTFSILNRLTDIIAFTKTKKR